MDPNDQLERARRGELSSDELSLLSDAFATVGEMDKAWEVSKIDREKQKQDINELRYAAEKTIRQIYRPNGQPSFPRFNLRTDVEPSIEGHKLRGMDPQRAAYVNGISGSEFWDRLNEVVVPIRIEHDGEDPALITSEFDPQLFPLKYENEIDVQVNVQSLVRDAIACLGCVGILDTSLEISFYGITPDIIVVFQSKKLIFVIEVKAPNRPRTRDNVFESDLVGGQIWLYLMSMKQAGVVNPLGAICTFNQIRIVSLNDMSDHPFEKALDKLKQDKAKPWTVEKVNHSKNQPSPDPKRQSASEKSKKFEFEHAADSFDATVCKGVNVFKAHLYGGKIVSMNDVLPMLLLGLKTALIEVGDRTDQTLTVVKKGDDLGSRQFAFATERAIRFARAPKELTVTSGHPYHSCKNFYLLDSIGRGHQGEVSLAVSTQGDPAAVNFYHIKPSRKARRDEREAENQEKINEAQKQRDEELRRWDELYPGRGARPITFEGLPCLLMPYGTQIPHSERETSLPLIRDELKNFSEKAYAYTERDLRWRHVLRDMKGKIFLADLLSLDKFDKLETQGAKIDTQMTFLKAKIEQAAAGGGGGGNKRSACSSPGGSEERARKGPARTLKRG
jgi:hypothetical protein